MQNTGKSATDLKKVFDRVQKNNKYIDISDEPNLRVRSLTGAFNAWLDPYTQDIRYYPNINIVGFEDQVVDFYQRNSCVIGTESGPSADLEFFFDRNIATAPKAVRNLFIQEYQAASRKNKPHSHIDSLELFAQNISHFKPQSVPTRRNAPKTLQQVMDNVKAANSSGVMAKLVNVSALMSDGFGATEFSVSNKTNRYREYDDISKPRSIRTITLPMYPTVVSSTINGVKAFVKQQGMKTTEGDGKIIVAGWKDASDGKLYAKAATGAKKTVAKKTKAKKASSKSRSASPKPKKKAGAKKASSKSPSRSASPKPKKKAGAKKAASKSRSRSASPKPKKKAGAKKASSKSPSRSASPAKKRPGPKPGAKKAASKSRSRSGSPKASPAKKRPGPKPGAKKASSKSPSRSASPAKKRPGPKPGAKKAGAKKAASKSPSRSPSASPAKKAGAKKAASKSPSRSPSASPKASPTKKRPGPKPGAKKAGAKKAASKSRSPSASPKASPTKKRPGPKPGAKKAASKSPSRSPSASPKASPAKKRPGPKPGSKRATKTSSPRTITKVTRTVNCDNSELEFASPQRGTIRM